mgnify:FL=1|jgi:hydroxyacylglutathione hydrolase|tara:strand:+ start:4383 stop:5174 length:792 start_codon:yes stop_codon:yes gene_type:complete
MNVIQLYTHSPLRNFTYLIGNTDRQYWCIDPFDGQVVADKLHELDASLVGIINTHEHDDHTCGNQALLRLMACSVVAGHPDCGQLIPGFSRALSAGDTITIDVLHQLKVLDTPGHSRGHVCLLLQASSDKKPLAVFSGDILFNAGVGHCRAVGASVEDLYTTLAQQFHVLDDSVTVYPGHEYLTNNLEFSLSIDVHNRVAKAWLEKTKGHDWQDSNITTTIADERLFNPFFRLSNDAIKRNLNVEGATEREVFIALRAKRDKW